MRQPVCSKEELAEALDGALVALKRAAKCLEANGCHGSALGFADAAWDIERRVYGPASSQDVTC